MAEENVSSGERLARAFKYHLQFMKQGVVSRPIPLDRIRAKGLYERGAEHWSRVASAFEKHGLDASDYARFLVKVLKFTDRTDPAAVSDPASVKKYQAYLQYEKKRDDAYGQYNRTVEALAAMCVRERRRCAECLSGVIRSGSLAQLYVCGVVSKYFLAAIPGFGKAVDRLDYFARHELRDLKDKYDIYRAIVCDAFIHAERRKPDPVQDVDFRAAALAKAAKNAKAPSAEV